MTCSFPWVYQGNPTPRNSHTVIIPQIRSYTSTQKLYIQCLHQPPSCPLTSSSFTSRCTRKVVPTPPANSPPGSHLLGMGIQVQVAYSHPREYTPICASCGREASVAWKVLSEGKCALMGTALGSLWCCLCPRLKAPLDFAIFQGLTSSKPC